MYHNALFSSAMFLTKSFLLISFSFFFLGSCTPPANNNLVHNKTIDMKDSSFHYNLENPSLEFKLSKDLKEISGMSCYKDKYLITIQDEKGTIELIDINSGETVDLIDFSADGDYEGVACVGEIFYVLRSDGVLFRTENWDNKKKIQTKIIDTNLGEINNTEGLAYDEESNCLLIACKGSASIEEVDNTERAVYSYDLNSSKFNIEPILSIKKKHLKKFVKANIKADKDFEEYKKLIKEDSKTMILEPSGIAVHPFSKHYYILSAVNNSLLVVDRTGEILALKTLSKKEFEQAEGITFSSNGDLFISSEGEKRKARIFKFDYIPTL